VRYSLTLAALCGAPALAASLSVSIEVPRLSVAEYHRPYVAAWVERADQSVAGTLALWYDTRTKGNAEGEGTKWLKDLRQWWRRTGRELSLPIDGVSGATRPAGTHAINVNEGSVALPKLEPGAYKLYVEAVREVGGREIVNSPFQWPPAKAATSSIAGHTELGEVKLGLTP